MNSNSLEEKECTMTSDANPSTYIFDLDGTLYDFGWWKFSESRLWIQVRKRYHEIIEENQLWDPVTLYDAMVERERNEKIGTSQQLAELLTTTRSEVLWAIWWGINPNDVIQNHWYAQEIIPLLGSQRKRLFVVTAAPKVWAMKALEYMALCCYFEIILTLEDFWSSKKEPFQKIQELTWSNSKDIISIWDQEHSDIIPAKELWMETLHVSGPHDLYKLIPVK